MTSAGEVEQFAYCAHNWQLARQGHDPQDQSRRGIEEHARHGRAVTRAERQRRAGRDGLTWSFRVLAAAGSASFLALELVFLRAHPHHLVFLTTALVLTSASAGLLTIGLEAERRLRKIQHLSNVVPGQVVAGDLLGSDVLQDPEWGLSGKPDMVMATTEGVVPVELKTGHTPAKPYDSHVLQLSCYLRLLEATNGKEPPYGLVQYPEGVFRVDWNDALRQRLRDTLGRIDAARKVGVADRDHDQPGRCRGCARRDACSQRLA